MATERFGGGGINVEGLAELRKALKELDAGFPKELRKANKSVADFVASDAKSAAYSIGSTAAHVAPSIKASAGQLSAGVALSGEAAAGAEFGGRGRPTTQQFQPHRGTQGYFVYPTIRRNMDRIETEYDTAIADLIKRAGLA
ncbi:MAG TPA: hypothetical protein VMM60_12075 [Ilumatobacter sp.]|nr:hypothetical protein [Ilumatobacter sp.]